MHTTWSFHSAGSILFGLHAADELGRLCLRHGLTRVYVVADEALLAAGIVEEVRRPLVAAGIEIEMFTGGEREFSVATADRAARQGRAFGPNAVLGVGGGSNMDLAKVAALLLSHGGTARDYFGENKLPGPVLPIVCVPTTAGTGSEVSGSCVITDDAQQLKVSILDNFLRPKLAVVDPRLALSCPRQVTADAGIDALVHAIEAYTAIDNELFQLPPGEATIYQGRHLLSDALAEKAITLVGEHLVTAVEEPSNLSARSGMALAALLAGLAFSNSGVALVHALEYPLGGAVHVSHGAGNGLLLPHVMRYNRPGREERLAKIAALLGRNVAGLEEFAAANEAIVAVEQLQAAIGIPRRLRDLGVRAEQLSELAEKSAKIHRLLRVNPRWPTVPELVEILTAAF